MISIVNRFADVDGTKGYVVQDGEFREFKLGRALYELLTLESLIEAGYKVMSYDEDIIAPDGTSIKQLEEVPFAGTMDEKQMMFDEADMALTESEVAPYLTRELNIASIEMLKSANEIKTRSELERYLIQWERTAEVVQGERDVRPLNSFVSPEALYSVEEYVKSGHVRDMFKIITKRRCIKTSRELKRLKEFLAKNTGVTVEELDDISKFQEAYISWGICGFDFKYVERKLELSTANQSFIDRSKANSSHVMRKKALGILKANGEVTSGKYSANFKEYDDIADEDGDIRVLRREEYVEKSNTLFNWHSKYNCVTCAVKLKVDRIYMKVLDRDGVLYSANVDPYTFVILNSSNTVYTTPSFEWRSLEGNCYALTNYLTEKDQLLRTLAFIKAKDLVKDRTVKAPVNSTLEVLKKEGLNTYSAADYICRRIQDDPEGNSHVYSSEMDYLSAIQLYKEGVEGIRDILNYFDIEEKDGDSLDDVIELLELRLQDTFIAMEGSAISPNDPILEYSHDIESLSVASKVVNGEVDVDEFARGKKLDNRVSIEEIVTLILDVIAVEQGGEITDIELAKSTILNIGKQDFLLDFSKIIPVMDKTIKGYLKDRALLNKSRVEQATTAICVEAVIREISNADAQDQRHYAMQCTKFDYLDMKGENYKAFMALTKSWEDCLMQFINKPLYGENLIIEAPVLAMRTIFSFSQGNRPTISARDGVATITTSVKLEKEETVELKIAEKVVNYLVSGFAFEYGMYLTLFDYCDLERSSNGAFNLYCVNANIDPWHVRPKRGFDLVSGAFAINYAGVSFIKKRSEEFQKKALSNRFSASGDRGLISRFGMNDVVGRGGDFAMMMGEGWDEDEILNNDVHEDIRTYYDRFIKAAAKCKPDEYVKYMRLKSDVVYGVFADESSKYYVSPDSETIMKKSSDRDNLKIWTECDILQLKSEIAEEDNLLDVSGNKWTDFNIIEESCNRAVAWDNLIQGKVLNNATARVVAGRIIRKEADGVKQYALKDVKLSLLEELAEQDSAYQIGAREFVMCSMNGYIKVEVVNV